MPRDAALDGHRLTLGCDGSGCHESGENGGLAEGPWYIRDVSTLDSWCYYRTKADAMYVIRDARAAARAALAGGAK